MNNLAINVGDFETIRSALVDNMIATGRFTEYDFAGSNAAALIDLLAYNTYVNVMHNHLAINESFRTTAKIRRNVAARAEEVNYVPRSFRSSVATIRVVIRSTLARGAIAIPKGTMFTSRVDNRLFTFTTAERAVAQYTTKDGDDYVFTADLSIYEGIYTTDTFIYRSGELYEITNDKVDTTSLQVSVIEDGGQSVTNFTQARTALDVNGQSPVYFLGTAPSGRYRLQFGDGVTGREPKEGSTIVAEYRVSAGRLPNGAKTFKAGQAIDGESDITITTIFSASSGDIYEDADAIKFNASNSLRTQERGAGENDYAILLQRENSDIIDVIATGGEKLTPPQYGKVFLSVASNQYTKLPTSRKKDLSAFLAKRSMMEPVIVDPEFMFLRVTSNVSFDPNTTNLTSRDIQSFAAGAISKYAAENLGKFASKFVRSKFVAAIDAAHPSITGNDTTVELIKEVTATTMSTVGLVTTFNNPVESFTSSTFIYSNRSCRLEADVDGIHIIDVKTGEQMTDYSIGSLDFETGELQILPTAVASSTPIKLIGQGYLSTITTPPNTVLQLQDDDVQVNIV